MSTATLPELHTVLAKDAMHSPVSAVGPQAELTEVAAIMGERRIHCVIVEGIRPTAAGERLVWGVVSDLDLIRGALEQTTPTAGSMASTEALCVEADDELGDVATALVAHEVAHAIVMEDGEPVGVISTLDIASAIGA